MAASDPSSPPNSREEHPTSLDPSELGTKEYWDDHYSSDIQSHSTEDEENTILDDPLELETWFDDVNAPIKILKFLTSETFPLSPNFRKMDTEQGNGPSHASILDLGTGNGSSLLTLRLQGSYYGYMVGVDYSPQSVQLARVLGRQYANPSCTTELSVQIPPAEYGCDKLRFEILDLINDDPRVQDWWPRGSGSSSGVAETGNVEEGFDLVLDKGTFDAISLSSDTVTVPFPDENATQVQTKRVRIHERYPQIVWSLLKPGGFFLITSCNWTEEEVIHWFMNGEGVAGCLEVFDTIKYPIFQFGGHKGQGVASVCFWRKVKS